MGHHLTLHDSSFSGRFWEQSEPFGDSGERVVPEETSEPVESGAEPGLGEIAVRLSLRPARPEQGGGGASGPGEGEGDEAHQEVELAGSGEAGVFEVEAAGFGVAEQAFDRPALAIGGESLSGGDIGNDDQPLVLQTPGGEVQERRVAGPGVVTRAGPGAEEPGPPGAAQAGGEGEVVAVLVGDAVEPEVRLRRNGPRAGGWRS